MNENSERSGAKIILGGLEQNNRRQQDRRAEDEEVLEDIRARVNEYIKDFISAEIMELAGEETQKLLEIASIFAEQTTYSMEAAIGAIMNALNGNVNPKKLRRALFGLTTAWNRKEVREKRRVVERETASCFRQRKARETVWAARKRTGPRQREWRGPWKENR